MCRFKFRLWNCLSYSQNSETAGLHKAIINIKRSRRQAVTALNIIVIVNYPFEKHYILASLVKGRWIDGKAQVLILLLSACDMPIICLLQTFCCQDGGIALHPPTSPFPQPSQKYIHRHASHKHPRLMNALFVLLPCDCGRKANKAFL